MSAYPYAIRASQPLLANKSLLITGGTGSFGSKLVEILLNHSQLRRIIIYSRNELKQYQLRQKFARHSGFSRLRFFIGDVRDSSRLAIAFNEIDFVIHAAALKQIDTCEYNPTEAIRTNIQGTINVTETAIAKKVRRVVLVSTDKAVSPANLYGATKLVAERQVISANIMAGSQSTRFSVVRYGNVIGSNASVVGMFMRCKAEGRPFPITDKTMTRFVIRVSQGVGFVLRALTQMQGGEIYVPKLPSVPIVEIAAAIDAKSKLKEIGIRPGEKIHEILISDIDDRSIYEFKDYFVIYPKTTLSQCHPDLPESGYPGSSPVASDFCYSSQQVTPDLQGEKLAKLIFAGYSELHDNHD